MDDSDTLGAMLRDQTKEHMQQCVVGLTEEWGETARIANHWYLSNSRACVYGCVWPYPCRQGVRALFTPVFLTMAPTLLKVSLDQFQGASP